VPKLSDPGDGLHLWSGGQMCHKCQLIKKLAVTGIVLYWVNKRWTAKRPNCQVVASGDGTTD
jgi:hypothetical protein